MDVASSFAFRDRCLTPRSSFGLGAEHIPQAVFQDQVRLEILNLQVMDGGVFEGAAGNESDDLAALNLDARARRLPRHGVKHGAE